jgi:tetratricopeptide (TPR) repeat protein
MHGHWEAARRRGQDLVNAQVTFERMERELLATASMAQRAPLEILNRGAGWGALELHRRRQAGEPSFLTAALPFDDESITDEQAPWLELLRTGRFPEAPPGLPPGSWMVQDQWREMLEQSVGAGPSDHWLAWLHLGIMYLYQKRYDDARSAWEKSVSMQPSAWAYRNLAALAAVREDYQQAARIYPLAVELAPDVLGLVRECGRAMINAAQPQKWLEVTDRLPPAIRADGHIRLLEAQAALAVDRLERAYGVLKEELVLTNVREGDGGPAHLWFAYHEKRLARELGVPVNEQLKERVRREFPPPAHLDYRLH